MFALNDCFDTKTRLDNPFIISVSGILVLRAWRGYKGFLFVILCWKNSVFWKCTLFLTLFSCLFWYNDGFVVEKIGKMKISLRSPPAECILLILTENYLQDAITDLQSISKSVRFMLKTNIRIASYQVKNLYLNIIFILY